MRLDEIVRRTSSLRFQQYKTGRILRFKLKYDKPTNLLYAMAEILALDGINTYKTTLVFKTVASQSNKTKVFPLQFFTKEGKPIYVEKPSYEHHIVTRCQCLDFRHMWMWYDRPYKALLGKAIPYRRVPGSNRPPKNPDKVPGLCKHIFQILRYMYRRNLLITNNDLGLYLRRRYRKKI